MLRALTPVADIKNTESRHEQPQRVGIDLVRPRLHGIANAELKVTTERTTSDVKIIH